MMASSRETRLVEPAYRCSICVLVGLALVATSGGCLISHSKHRVVRQDEIRQHVTYESQYAQQTFLQRATDDAARERNGSEHSFAVPFLIGLSYTSELSENAYYNDQLMTCDANSDGVISNAEASAFAGPTHAPPPHFSRTSTGPAHSGQAWSGPAWSPPTLLPTADAPPTVSPVKQTSAADRIPRPNRWAGESHLSD